jgi:hypothetical protein
MGEKLTFELLDKQQRCLKANSSLLNDFIFLEIGKIFGIIEKKFCLYFLYLVFLFPPLLTIPNFLSTYPVLLL